MLEFENALLNMVVNAKEPTRVLNAQSDVVGHRSSVPHLMLMNLTERKIYIILITWQKLSNIEKQ